ncbi:enoyl-CoA hydratase/isomerase family protein [Burkholderiaceae bacterium FT117]|uniref:enoyl-CoA hydratase/isomerase family protein n=1 Tax=Zeimonas sediminis TaxID=2944268 RepID=UPI0023432454|nr:enoyl-CoA hydratase/isomerase family protein [Zeimonas sediminis]MCM5571292.1 enoyl-CoA hydratase/isomerase family protein [Zeimonas sediminis]
MSAGASGGATAVVAGAPSSVQDRVAPGPVSVDAAGPGIAALTLERADKGNALSAELVEGLIDAFDRVAADESVHTAVLRARGRHFCTGFDLTGLEGETDASLLARFVRIEILLDQLWRAPVRTVAIGQGRIMGAGADLFAACDLRLLAPGASLRFPGAGFGIVLGTRRLAQRVGEPTALRWVSEGTTIGADEALSSGLATSVLGEDAGSGDLAPDAAPPDAGAALSGMFEPLSVDRATWAALRAAVRDGAADADLAALVRSAARPGLKARIEAYRARQLGARAR